MSWPLARGQVVLAHIGLNEAKRLLIVSNNRRNRHLQSVLAVRLTTTKKPDIPSVVPLHHEDQMTGFACCDDIIEIFENEVVQVVGALTPSTMARVSRGLGAALHIA